MSVNKDIFLQYLNTAEIVYKDDFCITNLNTRKHRYDMLIDDIEDVGINPNHTFTVYFMNGDKCVFELYTLRPHYHPTDDVDIDLIIKQNKVSVETHF